MPLVIPADPEKVVVDFIHDLIPTLSDLTGWTVSTKIPDGQTPVKRIGVRSIGGSDEQVVADRPRVDIRVWGDGTEANRSRVARLLLAHLRKQFRVSLFAAPVPLPDPADNTKTLTLFTVELLLRGTQS
jgi:hypothetical protein